MFCLRQRIYINTHYIPILTRNLTTSLPLHVNCILNENVKLYERVSKLESCKSKRIAVTVTLPNNKNTIQFWIAVKNKTGLFFADILIDILPYVRDVEVGTWTRPNRITYGRQVLDFQITESRGTRLLQWRAVSEPQYFQLVALGRAQCGHHARRRYWI